MLRLLTSVLLAGVASWTASGQPYTISTVAGGGLPVNIPGTSASLDEVQGVLVDKAGNVLFSNVADGVVLRLDAATGGLTLVAGNGTWGYSGDDGSATSAQMYQPRGLAMDSAGNLYIADSLNHRIRKVSNGVITTVAGNGTRGFSGDNGPATSAQLNNPYGVAADSAGNLYIADTGNSRVRKVSGGVITTVAGNGTAGFGGDNGPATSAQLNNPYVVAMDSAGNLYIADRSNSRIRKVSNGTITTVAGNGTPGFGGDNGPATSAMLSLPSSVAVDSAGNLYIADYANYRIRKVSNGTITTVAGNGTQGSAGDNGPATSAQFMSPVGIAVDSAGNPYVADWYAHRIRKISNGAIATVAGGGSALGDNGPAASARFDEPWGIAVDSVGSLYIADVGNQRIRKVTNGVVTTVAGNGTVGFSGDNGPAASAQLNYPYGVAVDSAGNLYIADSGNDRIRKVSNGVITTFAGNAIMGFSGDNGPATSAELSAPVGVAVDSAGSVYIAGAGDNRIRKVSNGVIATVAGNGTRGFSGDGGPATSAQLNTVFGMAVDSAGSLYIADAGNNRIRKVSSGVITTVAGNGTAGFSGDNGPAASAQLYAPYGVAVDSAGNLYIADTENSLIRKVSNGVIATIAGNWLDTVIGDNGPATGGVLTVTYGIALDSSGKLFVGDTYNNRVRMLTPGAAPAISHGGVVPVYSPVSTIQPGSWVSIYGSDLASTTALWNGDFPTSLGGTSVTIDGKPAYLWYVSPTQINLQVPDDTATGTVDVVVTTGSGTAASTVTLAPYGPSLSLLGDGRHVAGEILTPNGTGAYGGGTYDLGGPSNTFSYNTRPVKAGETLVLFGVGFGPTTPHVPAGQVFTAAAPTTSPVTITIGGVPALVGFSGITEAGLYQINLTVPQGTGSGDQALVATVNGVQTPLSPVVSVQ
jgi:uncharacterized protein (TIGR03437 family)